MKIESVPFSITEWGKVPPEEKAGETGVSYWQIFEQGNLRVRMVEYSPGFRADHWCSKGHVLLVLEGELVLKLKDGQEFIFAARTSFQVEDDEKNPHMVYTEKGAKVFIVD
jgi:quercetin dioxygenase-like cupin family protein